MTDVVGLVERLNKLHSRAGREAATALAQQAEKIKEAQRAMPIRLTPTETRS